jgi:hypothetical protein
MEDHEPPQGLLLSIDRAGIMRRQINFISDAGSFTTPFLATNEDSRLIIRNELERIVEFDSFIFHFDEIEELYVNTDGAETPIA